MHEQMPPVPPTALMVAAKEGNLAQVEALLLAGHDRCASESGKRTALTVASVAGHADIVKCLCQKDMARQLPGTALLAAVSRGKTQAARELLLAWPEQEPLPHPLAYLAAHHGNIELFQLVAAKVDTLAQTQNYTTAMMAAVQQNHTKIVEYLLSKGVPLEHKNVDGNTALALAANQHNPVMVKKLLDAGANPNCTNNTGGTPLMVAVLYTDHEENSHFPLAQLCMHHLLDAGADWSVMSQVRKNSLQLAAACHNAWAVETLLDHGADIHTEDECGRSLQYYASKACWPVIKQRMEREQLDQDTHHTSHTASRQRL